MFPKQNTMSYCWFLMTIKRWRFTELPFLELALNLHRITSRMGENNINCIYLIVPRMVFPWFPLISCQSYLFDWCKMSQSKCLKEKPKEDINNTVTSKEARMDKLEKKIKKKRIAIAFWKRVDLFRYLIKYIGREILLDTRLRFFVIYK